MEMQKAGKIQYLKPGLGSRGAVAGFTTVTKEFPAPPTTR